MTSLDPSDDANSIAAAKAERRADIQIDFDLEDIIAGNRPESDTGQRLSALVDDLKGAPTQGRVEDALIPIYEAASAVFFREEGGSGEPPVANRAAIRQHATKLIQARKVKRMALMRAGRAKAAADNRSFVPHLVVVAALLAVLVVVLYVRS